MGGSEGRPSVGGESNFLFASIVRDDTFFGFPDKAHPKSVISVTAKEVLCRYKGKGMVSAHRVLSGAICTTATKTAIDV
jgi:hypothetical protein